MARRKLEELNLIDDFLFESLVCHPEFGEAFCRILLSILMQREIGKVKVVPQKVYPGSDTDRHGSRLDVYVEEYFASGAEYLKLRHVYVIMITTFDPFGYDRILYTVRNTCMEVPGLPYDDGAATFFFYTKGRNGKCADEIRELLHIQNTADPGHGQHGEA